ERSGGKKDEKAAKAPAHVAIDFDGLPSRIVSVPGVPEKPYALLKAGEAGTGFYIETTPVPGGGAQGGPRGTLTRVQLSERKPQAFANDVADYAVSADGKKLVYRAAAPVEAALPGLPPPRPSVPNLFLVDADKAPPAAGAGKLALSLSMWLDPRAEFAQIFAEGWRN